MPSRIVNWCYIYLTRIDRTKAEPNDFEFANDRIRMGIGRKNMLVSDKEKLMTAYHEGKKIQIIILKIRWPCSGFSID